MERQLAVKRFHPALLATPGVSSRLSQAARTYGGLDHPRLARLAELGVAGGETFTAVEWVNGLDTARLLAMANETGSPLPVGATLSLISAAARAIGYAHGRGVCHLGLSPTNLIATADGDVKVTDVGILACRLPPRPSADPSLGVRIAYLAPEQLIGEPVSAASDVFVLGVIAYELVAGMRPFNGTSTLELEQAVLSGRPASLELPRPVVRVIDRCLARSPFERFPDARALADALDAALRLSPMAGGRRDIGDRVTAALEHIARVNEQQLSGALSFAVPTPPLRPGTGLPLPPPPLGRTGAMPQMPRNRGSSVSAPSATLGHTLRGAAPASARMPTEQTGDPTISRDEPDESNLSVGDDTVPRIAPMWPPTEQVPTIKPPPQMLTRTIAVPPPPPPPPPSTRPVGSNPPPFDASRPPPSMPEGSPAPLATPMHGEPMHGEPIPAGPMPGGSMPGVAMYGGPPQPYGPPPHGPPHGPHGPHGPPMMGMPMGGPQPHQPPPAMGMPHRPRGLKIMLVVAIVCAVAGVAAVAAFFIHRELTRPSGEGTVAQAPGAIDAGAEPIAALDGGDRLVVPAKIVDADEGIEIDMVDAAAAMVAIDAGAEPAAVDAAADPDPGPGDKLVITSEPAGARVFIDGADKGKTPVTLAASSDRHNVAIVLPGYDLHLAEIDGNGTHAATLKAVTPPEGPGGIKVRCKSDDRYYVFLDGKPTGQLCPTERLGVGRGEYTVEVYDLVTETRRQFTAKVKELKFSVRIRVD